MKNFFKLWLPVLLVAAIIFIFSSNPDPYQYLPDAFRSTQPFPSISDSSLNDWIGQTMHFVEYAILAFLLYRALWKTPRVSRSKIALMSVIFGMVYALSDEIHQIFVPERTFQLVDLLTDLLGVLFGVYIYHRLKIKPPSRKVAKVFK